MSKIITDIKESIANMYEAGIITKKEAEEILEIADMSDEEILKLKREDDV